MKNTGKPPIPDPTQHPHEELKSCPSFRVRFWPCLVITEGICVLILGSFYGAMSYFGWGLNTADCTRLFTVGAISSFIEACVYPLLFTVAIHPEKLRGHTFWGFESVMSWHEIAGVRCLSFCGLPYLLVRPKVKNKLPLWLPLFLRDMKKFRQEIIKHTPPHHPLREWLEERFSQ